MGLIPMLAQWATSLLDTVLAKAGSSLAAVAPLMGSSLDVGGLVALGQGGLLTSMLWAAALALMVERKFTNAAAWMAAASVLSALGVIHAYTLTPGGVENKLGLFAAPAFTLSYAAAAVFLAGCHFYATRSRQPWIASQ